MLCCGGDSWLGSFCWRGKAFTACPPAVFCMARSVRVHLVCFPVVGQNCVLLSCSYHVVLCGVVCACKQASRAAARPKARSSRRRRSCRCCAHTSRTTGSKKNDEAIFLCTCVCRPALWRCCAVQVRDDHSPALYDYCTTASSAASREVLVHTSFSHCLSGCCAAGGGQPLEYHPLCAIRVPFRFSLLLRLGCRPAAHHPTDSSPVCRWCCCFGRCSSSTRAAPTAAATTTTPASRALRSSPPPARSCVVGVHSQQPPFRGLTCCGRASRHCRVRHGVDGVRHAQRARALAHAGVQLHSV
jgi:hypothetical protein